MIKKVMKSIVAFINIFVKKAGYNLIVHKSNMGEYFAYSMVTGFDSSSGALKIYADSIRHVDGQETDNIYKKMRLQIMMQLLENVVRKNPNLDAAECGCWNGHSTHMSSILMKQLGFKGQFHVFDSFEGGLSAFTEHDRNDHDPISKEQEDEARDYFGSSLEAVEKRLSEFDFVHLYKGWIPDRFEEVSNKKFGFVFIDVDMYEPILDSLKFFYPRLADGGFIFLDDYNYAGFPGAKRAIDTFLQENTPSSFIFMPFGSAFIMK